MRTKTPKQIHEQWQRIMRYVRERGQFIKYVHIMARYCNRMSVCNGARNFKRTDVIRAIAFRYYDNIRACVGRFNYDDDSEYNKEYSRAQYMNA